MASAVMDGERSAIQQVCDRNPHLGPRTLANKIYNRDFPYGTASHVSSGKCGAPARTFYSIYSVIRRYLAKKQTQQQLNTKAA